MKINAENIELTILMPCLNEAETLAVCISKAQLYLTQHNIRGEVLIADNGSTDGSQDIALQHGARLVHVAQKGYGAALIHGIDSARGTFVIMGDADDSYDFTALTPFIEKLRAGYALVVGNRFLGGIKPGAMPFLHRYIGNPVLSFIGRLFFKIPIQDFHCGLRGFAKDAIQKLQCHTLGMEFASEMIAKAALANISMTEVPTTLAKDGRTRPPHLRTWRDGWRHLCFLLMCAPRWLFIYPGLIMFILGTITSAILLYGDIHIGSVVFGVKTFIISSLTFIMGLQYLTFGIITRQYATLVGMLPPSQNYSKYISQISRDNIILIAAVFFLSGIFLCIWCLWKWAEVNFGHFSNPHIDKLMILSMTFLACSMQMFLAGFIYAIMSTTTEYQ